MTARAKTYRVIAALTGLTYVLFIVIGVTGVAWIVPAAVAGAAYTLAGTLSR
jgi:hypothetical protein